MKKIDAYKIKHQFNTIIFLWYNDNPIKTNWNKLWSLILNNYVFFNSFLFNNMIEKSQRL
jgi:hypothetical protein